MAIPSCPACKATAWTGTYRAQVERWWSTSDQDSQPQLVYEDEDHGEWAEIDCERCRAPVPDWLRDQVLTRLLGGE